MLRSSLLIIFLLIIGCSKVDYQYQLLTSAQQHMYNYQIDNNLKIIKKNKTKYNINHVHPSLLNKQTIEIVEGLKKRELVLFNLEKNTTKEISEPEDNPIVFLHDGQFVYHSSNYISDNYLKSYDLTNKKSHKIALANFLVSTIIKDLNVLYLIGSDYNNDDNYLLQIKDNKMIKKTKLDYAFDQSNNALIKDNKLMYTYQGDKNYLIAFDLKTHQINKTKLKTNNNILKVFNDKVYAYQRDLVMDESFSSLVEDIANNKTVNFKQAIKEIINLEDNILLIGDKSLFLLDNNLKIIKENSQIIEGDIISVNKNAS